jgi:hypothetical protein
MKLETNPKGQISYIWYYMVLSYVVVNTVIGIYFIIMVFFSCRQTGVGRFC